MGFRPSGKLNWIVFFELAVVSPRVQPQGLEMYLARL